ncbi:MAG: polysaccharide deacetylase family protein [Pirellulales bacterium]|nr:polysaccharide deacetylase family protein [Pirellulales bacterium]
MKLWKQLALASYYHTTRPLRAVRNRRLFAAGQAPVIALYYHRVADDAANPWTTSNAEFRRHIDWLAHRFEFVSLAEAQQRIRSRSAHKPCVTITFDDGYADNSQQALPYLLDKEIPFTYFVTTSAVLLGEEFPHDLEMGNRLLPNSLEEIIALAECGVEIGAHTRTHANLGAIHDEEQLVDEVVRASEELQAAIPTPLRYFAFPFGMYPNLNSRVFDLAHSAGFEGVCSAYGGYNFPGDDAFHIQRIGADGPLIRIKNAATLDPLRYMNTPRYSYDIEPAALEAPAEVPLA